MEDAAGLGGGRMVEQALAAEPSAAERMRSAMARPAALPVAVAGALVVTAVLRLFVGADEQLWLDEVWTGWIAGQTSLSAFGERVLSDINAPLYYGLMYLWAAPFGIGNAALRAPSVLLGLAVPLVALAAGRFAGRGPALVWAGLLACWTPGLWMSQEARGYGLLLLLCTAATLLHGRWLARPDRARAIAWAGVAALAVLTHYYALILVACQAATALWRRPREVLRSWPAALAFLPVAAWLAIHLPRLVEFTGIAWYSRLSIVALPWVLTFALGPFPLFVALLGLGIREGLFGLRMPRAPGPAGLAVAAGVAAALITIACGFARPVFTLRYLTPCVPALLLGTAMWAGAVACVRPAAPALLVAASLAAALVWAAGIYRSGARTLGFETASDILMAARPTRLVFLWDNPSARGMRPDEVAAVGGFFFRRAGRPVEADGIVLAPGEDPHGRLLASAREQGAAILWVYDLGVPGTAALAFPPAISREPGWTCRDLGRGEVGILACLRVSRAAELASPGLLLFKR